MITTANAAIKEVRENLGFNRQLTKIDYEKNTGLLRFKFWVPSHGRLDGKKEVYFFDMRQNSCDYSAFDEFAYHCIDGFDSESMTDLEIIKKSEKLYRATVTFFKKASHSQFFS